MKFLTLVCLYFLRNVRFFIVCSFFLEIIGLIFLQKNADAEPIKVVADLSILKNQEDNILLEEEEEFENLGQSEKNLFFRIFKKRNPIQIFFQEKNFLNFPTHDFPEFVLKSFHENSELGSKRIISQVTRAC